MIRMLNLSSVQDPFPAYRFGKGLLARRRISFGIKLVTWTLPSLVTLQVWKVYFVGPFAVTMLVSVSCRCSGLKRNCGQTFTIHDIISYHN